MRTLLLSIALLAASPVFAFESHVVNVRMSLTAPVNIDRGELELGADGIESAGFTVALTPSFLDQTRLGVVDYRIIASLEPIDGHAAGDATPTVVCVRDSAERDGTPDEAEHGLLGTSPMDTSDRWVVTLRPSDDVVAGVPDVEVSASETPPADPAVSASGSAEATVSATEPVAASRWSVHIRVEVIGYGAMAEAGE